MKNNAMPEGDIAQRAREWLRRPMQNDLFVQEGRPIIEALCDEVERLEHVRERLDEFKKMTFHGPVPLATTMRIVGYADELLSLIDSEAASGDTASLLRRLKDFLFDNCDHAERDRNYDWCPSCVMAFMEIVARPSQSDTAASMRDLCVEKVKDIRTTHRISDNQDYEYGFEAALDAVGSKLRDATLDGQTSAVKSDKVLLRSWLACMRKPRPSDWELIVEHLITDTQREVDGV